MSENKQVVTPKARIAFPHLFEREVFEGEKAKFSVTLLFPKDTDIKKLKNAAKAAIDERWSRKPKSLKIPFKDGDAIDDDGEPLYPYDGYEGCIVLKCSTDYDPGIVDASRAPINDPEEVYGGCYGRAYVQAFCYERKMSKGVSFALIHFQKLDEGERFANRTSAQDAFDDDISSQSDAGDVFEFDNMGPPF